MRCFPPPHFLRGENPGFAEDATYTAADPRPSPASLREYEALGMMFRRKGDWQCFIPHWLTLGVVVLTWAALLPWRAWRRGKHHESGVSCE